MTISSFARTLLGSVAVCAALLLAIGYALGPRLPAPGAPGLTAAAVLATDGMGPDGSPNDLPGNVSGSEAPGTTAVTADRQAG